MKSWLKNLLAALLSVLLLLLLLFVLLLKYPTQDPPPENFYFASPKLTKLALPPLKIRVLETAFTDGPEAFEVRGGSLFNTRRMVFSSILIEHPKGIVIIDGGLGTGIDQQMSQAPWFSQLISYHRETPLTDQLKGQKLDPKRDFFLLTHGHWDHVSGTLDFPGIPIRMLRAEQSFLTQDAQAFRHGVFPHQVEKIRERVLPLDLKDQAYENFLKSLDLFGDGSLVLVDLSGHTPGSLGVFINLSSAKRFLVVGDALWSVDSHGKPEARSLLGELSSDYDRQKARRTRQQLSALIAHSNEVQLVPVHDAKALEKLKISPP